MSTRPSLRRVTLSVVCASSIVAVLPMSSTVAHASTDRLRLTFDSDATAGTQLAAGAPIVDVSGFANNGIVVTASGGSVTAVAAGAGGTGLAARFPANCTTTPCPTALVQIADHPSLDPRTADFEWGASILLQPNQTADGENVLQKGLYNQVGGQWKLQVDKGGGLPSCVVSGRVPGQTATRRAMLASSVGVADGIWHQVTCRRTAEGLVILVDGVVRGSVAMPVVDLNSDAPVTVGNKFVDGTNTDQFHGELDDAFVTVLDDVPVPNAAPSAAFTVACADRACSFDASSSTDDGPLTYAWDFGDGSTDAVVAPTHQFAEVGDHAVTLVVTDRSGLTSGITHTVTIASIVAPVAPTFVGQASVSAQAVDHVATVPNTVQANDGLLLFLSVATGARVKQMTGVAGWVPVDALTNANGSTRVWRKVAAGADAGAQVHIKLSTQSKGNITIVAYRGTSAINPVAAVARTLITTNSSSRTTPLVNVAMASVVVSYWMHRDGTTTTLTPPAGVAVRATGTQTGTGHVTVLTADSSTMVPSGGYGGLTAQAEASSTLATTWTIVLASA